MVQIKAHEFKNLIAKGAPPFSIVLVYGPDRGLVSERADTLAKATGIALDDPFSVVPLDIGALQADPARLVDEVYSVGLFGGKRLIWIKGAANERALVDALDQLTKTPPADSTLLIEGGDLKKGSALRKIVEESRSALAIPCYADEGRTIHGLIDEEMAAAELRATSAARQLLVDLLGGDRLATRGELRKLALYCRGREVVGEEDVLAIVGDASVISVDGAVDAVLLGDVAAVDLALRRLSASKSPTFLVLQACLRQFQFLETMRASLEAEGKTAAAVINEQGRRIHFKRKPAIERALRSWSLREIGHALNHLQTAILESRRRATLEDSLVSQALLALALRSARTAAA